MAALFSVSIFVGAALLFLVEPMFARMVLPLLGGAPAVWNTCVVFYQAALFAGYLYAHLTSQYLSLRIQAVVHVVLLLCAAVVLPLAIGADARPPAGSHPSAWVLLMLLTTVGPPFVVLAATGPLFQRWLSVLQRGKSQGPYWLYAASNLGSLLALLSYPFVIEPLLGLRAQSRAWAAAYAAFVLLTAACAAVLWMRNGALDALGPVASEGPASAGASSDTRSWLGARLRWLGLAAVPAMLMLSVTTFISVDIAAIPLLWVVPLALYLVTLVIAFADTQVIPAWLVRLVFPLGVIGTIALVLADTAAPMRYAVVGHMGCFGIVALACHLQLAAQKPAPAHLTEYFLWVSAGGAIGGIFNTLVAPQLFVTPIEYPLAAIGACLLFPAIKPWPERWPQRAVAIAVTTLPLLLVVGLTAAVRRFGGHASDSGVIRYGLAGGPALGVCYLLQRTPVRMGLALASVTIAGSLLSSDGRVTLHVERTFFGVHRITNQDNERVLLNGTTNHGSQALDAALKCEPLTYYSREGPIGQLFASFTGGSPRTRFGVVGLGTASMAAYAKPDEHWSFFEINPAIERIARDARYFTYLRDCAPQARVVIGDARLSLEREPDASFDLLVLDAFSSDAIPVHLLTAEAMALYVSKLSPHGLLAIHISNRYLDLGPVVAALAGVVHAVAFEEMHRPTRPLAASVVEASPSRWAVIASRRADLQGIANDGRWQEMTQEMTVPAGSAWTDDYSNIFSAYRWHLKVPGL